MKCKNCGLPKNAHTAVMEADGETRWQCADGSGRTYPVVEEVQVALHYRAGEDLPWLARWHHPITGSAEVASKQPLDALECAGRAIETALEEKTDEEASLEKAIAER
jgi:hypothetical protein